MNRRKNPEKRKECDKLLEAKYYRHVDPVTGRFNMIYKEQSSDWYIIAAGQTEDYAFQSHNPDNGSRPSYAGFTRLSMSGIRSDLYAIHPAARDAFTFLE